ncbi:hypothetical protein [Mycolicibacterium arenosum]|uniref:FHA domain-containing protein n=1 Tax=Mycolicibacterium arenosum TaxID=2952157 RepID=A0ABT1MAF9_9MYCO|nr:hypothetical protein [Mycolicibacterium sp. CAU 1645]MCP9276141.1 hypothetical protein [Mycolicibacterium sp. CAU 1645]
MAKRTEKARAGSDRRRHHPEGGAPARRSSEAPARRRKPTREQRPVRSAPPTGPIARPTDAPARPKNAAQAKARAKARKAKAPKVVRPPLRERLLIKLSSIDLDPRRFVTRVPFVVLVIGALGLGLGVTLWLSTDAAERSYQLGHARETNRALMQQKDALERQVLEAQAAPALAESARELGMIPSRDTAHLVQDAAGGWMVVGTPKPAEGVSPPPLNTPLPEPTKPAPPPPPAPRVIDPREIAVRVPTQALPPNPEVMVAAPVPGAPAAPVPAVPAPIPAPPSTDVVVAAPAAPAPAVPAPGAAPEVPVAVAPLAAGPQHTAALPDTRPLPGPLPGPPPGIPEAVLGAPA